MDLADVLAGRDLTNKLTVPVLLSTEAADRILHAQDAVERAREAVKVAETVEAERMAKPRTEAAKADLADALAQLDEANTAAREHLIEFQIRSVGSALWDRLLGANRPTPEQVERHGPLRYNPETFPRVAVAFCLADPAVPQAEIDAYLDWLDRPTDDAPIPATVTTLKSKVPDVVWQQIWGAAHRVNTGVNQVPSLSSGSEQTRSSGSVSEPPSS